MTNLVPINISNSSRENNLKMIHAYMNELLEIGNKTLLTYCIDQLNLVFKQFLHPVELERNKMKDSKNKKKKCIKLFFFY